MRDVTSVHILETLSRDGGDSSHALPRRDKGPFGPTVFSRLKRQVVVSRQVTEQLG